MTVLIPQAERYCCNCRRFRPTMPEKPEGALFRLYDATLYGICDERKACVKTIQRSCRCFVNQMERREEGEKAQ